METPSALLQPIIARTGPPRFPTEAVTQAFTRRELARGDYWLREGEVCRKLVFLESGLLRYTQEHNGKLLTRWATLPGQFGLAFPSFIQQRPSEVAITAAEVSVVYELDRERWLTLRTEHAQLQEFWVAVLEYNLCCFEDRVWSLIAGDGEDRYRYMLERYPEFLLVLPQHFVADMLGVAPRHLSRIRGRFGRFGRFGR